MDDPTILTEKREQIRQLAEGMSVLAERDDLLQRLIEAAANGDPTNLRAILQELPGDPIGPDFCPHYIIVSLPVKIPIFERVCRWTCGIHAGALVSPDGSVELEGGRTTTLSQETIGVLEEIGVISCGLGGRFDRQFIDVWQQVCDPNFVSD